MALTLAQKQAITKQLVHRYLKASKKAKGMILDELCALTGWSRDHARRALRTAPGPGQIRPPPKTRKRSLTYGEEVLDPLCKIWATLNGPCGKRLAPFMAEIIEALERCGELQLDEQVKEKLLSMSAATIDRRLAPERSRLRFKGRSGTKPGSLLRHQIAIRTFSDWDDATPGFVECDLVGHEGGDPTGDFCHTLDLTDVASGWTEMKAVKNKAQKWVFEALLAIEADLPFDLKGLDSDNGGEFINDQMFRYCTEHQITFTRTRPYRKNDNCFVEQKNWTHVRQSVGYLRYDTEAELKVLNELYSHLRLYVNFFQPQMRLVEKTRTGAKVTKRYDDALTPYRRLLASNIPAKAKRALTDQYFSLNPVELKREIGRCQDKLMRLSKRKQKDKKPKTQQTSSTNNTNRSKIAALSRTHGPKSTASIKR